MRVGLITPRFPPNIQGGGEISAELLAEQLSLQPSVTKVTVFSFDGTERTIRESGLDINRISDVFNQIPEVANLQAIRAISEYSDEISDCDILHGYSMTLNPCVGYLSTRYDIPSVATLNSYDVLPKASFGVQPSPKRHVYEILAMPTSGRILRKYMAKIDEFITLSEASEAVYRRNGFDGESFTVIPNMLDPSFDPLSRADDRTGFKLLYVGSLIPEKGVETLVRATNRLSDDISVTIVGSGPEEGKLKRLSRDLGITDKITFTGHIPYERVKNQYATADAFIHPGLWPEPFGRTILEAMESELPVLVSDIGGPAEIIDDPLCRFAPGTPGAIVDAIERLRAREEDVGEYNRNRVLEFYSPDKVISEILEIYRSLV